MADRSVRPAGIAARARRTLNPFEYSLLRTLLQMVGSIPIWLSTRPQRFLDPEGFADVRALADAGPELAAECAAFVAQHRLATVQEADPAQRRLNRDDRWLAFMVRINGRDIEVNRGDLPKLSAFLDRHPDFTTAAVSVLEPGKKLLVHPGPNKGVLRVHLGVTIPTDGRCEMIVGGASRTWAPGEVMVFDDTYPHRAVNLASTARTVLFLDLVRPMPIAAMDRVNRRFISSLGRLQHVERIIASAEARKQEQACKV